MRVGKRATVVEAKKTRSCVVSPSPPPPARTTRAAMSHRGASQQQQQQLDTPSTAQKTLRGPLKKRPVSETATTSNTSSAATPTAAARAKEAKLKKLNREAMEEMNMETPPTIAAGRSRRAIKPNPKYTSEDVVTPKLMKNVGALGSSSDKKSGGDKQRSNSTSSSEDFYNKASSDEENFDSTLNSAMGDGDDDDADDDNAMAKVGKTGKQSESDYSETEPEVVRAAPKRGRGRGRPRKEEVIHDTLTTKASRLGTPPSQLQQLRKTLATSVHRGVALTPAGTKRKLETSSPVTEKRFKLPTAGNKLTPMANRTRTPPTRELSGAAVVIPKTLPTLPQRMPGQTLNGNRIIQLQLSSSSGSGGATSSGRITSADMLEKRKLLTERLTKIHAKTAMAVTPTPPLLLNRTGTKLLNITGQKRSASPATGTPAAVGKVGGADTPSSAQKNGEEVDGTPTFTIVNINDIINKKGDVLISKTATAQKSDALAVTAETTAAEVVSVAAAVGGTVAATQDGRLNRRKAGHTTILSDKLDPERAKPLTRTLFPPRRPGAQSTLFNHGLLNKATVAASEEDVKHTDAVVKTPAAARPAPRILNAMVAKKTLPVKPMIANLDDSTDDSLLLSLDDEEEDEEGDDGSVAAAATSIVEPEKPHTAVDRRRLGTSTPYTVTKKTVTTAAATKENSLAATNRLPLIKLPTQTLGKTAMTMPPSAGISKEKVIISRQGDKIIKKITCFENWYVLNMPASDDGGSSQVRLLRNQLDMPLIELANVAKAIKLPSSAWTSKVTLFDYANATNKTDVAVAMSMSTTSPPTLYTGDLSEQNIKEDDRAKYQPSCVMFRRAVSDRSKSRLPYDRAVIFKNKTFFTNIEGKNVKLEAAPNAIGTETEVEILLEIIDALSLKSDLVEPASTVQ